jgi:hypothetical protein
VYIIINDTSEEFDDDNNPIINPQHLQWGANHMAEGETKEIIVAREKVHLTTVEWETIKEAVNHGAVILLNSIREVLMGYQFALVAVSTPSFPIVDCLDLLPSIPTYLLTVIKFPKWGINLIGS